LLSHLKELALSTRHLLGRAAGKETDEHDELLTCYEAGRRSLYADALTSSDDSRLTGPLRMGLAPASILGEFTHLAS
jgi:hypothetical protein